MNTEQHTVGQEVGDRIHAIPTAIYQVAQPPYSAATCSAAALTLYQVPVPGAVPVQLPDGRTAWGRPVEHRLGPLPVDTAQREPVPAWAKAIGMVAGSLTALALGGALALRIAAPALGELVDLLSMLWKVALVLAVILFGAAARALFAKASAHTATRDSRATGSTQTIVFAPQIDTGGTRLLGRSGDVNIQVGNRHRNKQ
ncbi:hypothetical protein ACWGJT_03785 [Streptomyces xantholiticus]